MKDRTIVRLLLNLKAQNALLATTIVKNTAAVGVCASSHPPTREEDGKIMIGCEPLYGSDASAYLHLLHNGLRLDEGLRHSIALCFHETIPHYVAIGAAVWLYHMVG